MFINPNFYLALPLAAALFFAGRALGSASVAISLRRTAGAVFFLLALVSLSIPLTYLAGSLGENPAYANFRALPYAELTVCLAAPFVGRLSLLLPLNRGIALLFCLVITLGYVSLPFIKPIVRPAGEIVEQWRDGIAIQSTSATCGPASMATLMHRLGVSATQSEIARQSYNSGSGTENWYLARYAKSQGFSYRFLNEPDLENVPVPSIIGVRLGRVGHFITLLSKEGATYTVGDSLDGVHQLTEAEFKQRYRFAGFVLQIGRE
ncbi:Peptidase C39 family [Leminorella richardii]|uniref:Peptidase C39 family n=1 Tax=Leminorella richardii TaxID=158841 RepID=A0A2X4U617_9GAMM|nr:cysteine peptidase family C39 domain-containing protein [Leminorella richardii]SQI34441.1 Peptidase C39 family [Leminorella richardii]